MPGRNTIKIYVPNSYYHVYNRGLGHIFLDDEDYLYFESLLARHTSPKPVQDSRGREYRWYYPLIHVNAYCLMPNHFHLLIHQTEDELAISKFASSVLTAYTMYFNKKHKRRGPLFENTYKAVRIESDTQLMHITRYIHLNHRDYRAWDHSSYTDYLWQTRDWIDTKPILALFPSIRAYQEFVDDYEEVQRTRDGIKGEMADGWILCNQNFHSKECPWNHGYTS